MLSARGAAMRRGGNLPARIASPAAAVLIAAFILSACAGARAQTYDDPFAYCAAVGTVDAPDARYTGAPLPPSIAEGLRRAFRAPADAPLEVFTRGSSWRCMDGAVWACAVGANLACQAKADTSRTPSPAVAAFCRGEPSAGVVPAYVTGRETVYAWRCGEGAPAIARQVATADARGFLSNVWHRIAPP